MPKETAVQLQRTKKGYLVAHKDKINEQYHPETECQIICAIDAKSAIYKYFLNDFLPDGYRMIDIRARRSKEYDLYIFEEEEKTMLEINRIKEYRIWKSDMENLVKNNPNSEVYIYSGEHGAYWRPERRGYTDQKSEAGIYKIEDAWVTLSKFRWTVGEKVLLKKEKISKKFFEMLRLHFLKTEQFEKIIELEKLI